MKTTNQIAVLVSAFIVIFSCCSPVKKAKEKEAMIKIYMNTWTTHDIDKMVSFFTNDCIYEEVWSGRIFKGKNGVSSYAKETFDSIPDFKLEIASLHFENDWAYVEFIRETQIFRTACSAIAEE